MKIGFISDAHGNPYGLLQSVLKLEEEGAEEIYFLGDAVNYFSRSGEVIDILLDRNIPCISGNHEKSLFRDIKDRVREVYNIDCTLKNLTDTHMTSIRYWKDKIMLEHDGRKILLSHTNPDDADSYTYPDSDLSVFDSIDADIILVGHTHIPFIRKHENKLIINTGSCGLPRDDGRFVHCVILDTASSEAKIIRTDFPNHKLDKLRPYHPDVDKILARRKE